MSRKKEAPKKKSPLPLFIIFGVLIVAVIAGTLLISSNRSDGTRPTNAAPQPGNRVANLRPGAQPPQAKGRPDAPVVIEEFGDYQCPSCGFFNQTIKRVESQFQGRVYIIFRHLPLQSIHQNAALAARAAEAAGVQGKFWGMHDMIYENQKEWSDLPDPRPRFNDYAQRLGLNVEKFRTDTDSREVGARIMADVQRADSIGIQGTPAVFINGLPIESLKEEDLRREIEAALSRKGQ